MSLDIQSPIHRDSLADVLERILDKGVVIAGDVSISLVGIELLTIHLRLLVATVDKAKELGINWWESDPRLTAPREAAPEDALEAENRMLLQQIAEMETLVEELAAEKGDPA